MEWSRIEWNEFPFHSPNNYDEMEMNKKKAGSIPYPSKLKGKGKRSLIWYEMECIPSGSIQFHIILNHLNNGTYY